MQVESTEKVIERLSTHKGVEGIIVTDKDGTAINSTMDNTNTVMFAEGVFKISNIASNMIREIDPSDDLEFIRIGTKKMEVMSHHDAEYSAIAVQSKSKK